METMAATPSRPHAWDKVTMVR